MIRVGIPKTLILSDDQKKELSALGYEVLVYDKESEHSIESCEVWVGMTLEKMPKDLKFIQLLSAGFEHLDVEAIKSQGITIANGRGMTSQAIAEYCLGATLMVYRGFPQFAKNQEQTIWERNYTLKSLVGKSVVLMGTGNIANHILRLLEPFDCTVYGINSNGRNVPGYKKCYSLENRHEILGEADVVMMTLPYNSATYHAISHDEIKLMKKDAVLINVGRGGCVDMNAVVELLDTHLGHVVFDVFDEEPLSENHPLWHHPKAIITPHNSFYSDNLGSNQATIVMNNLIKYANKEELNNLI